jgi:hypothetical protein
MAALTAAWHASMAALTAMPEFHAWRRSNPAFKQLLSGSLWTAQGPQRVTALLDTGAMHCFICARLAVAGADLILGWDWISSHDLHHLFSDGHVLFRSGPARLQLNLLPAGTARRRARCR